MKNTQNQIEILAPAGSFDGLKAAVFSGCDAVYMGGTAFSARASAANFDREEMREALILQHQIRLLRRTNRQSPSQLKEEL